MSVSALAPWFGSNRMLGQHVGAELVGRAWVGVPFAGGMSELSHISARTVLVSDKHRHVINLARVAQDIALRGALVRRLNRRLFHPDELAEAQDFCREYEPFGLADLAAAENYFVCCWVGRSSKSGIDDEFNGRPAIRWNANGGDSNKRFRSAIRFLAEFYRIAKRCCFETMDAFEFIDRCEDSASHGVYCDPPFPGAGRKYRHNCGKTDDEERAWHVRLRDSLSRFELTRVVIRFYDHPMIRDLYQDDRWSWRQLVGRKQSNDDAPEVLIVNVPPVS